MGTFCIENKGLIHKSQLLRDLEFSIFIIFVLGFLLCIVDTVAISDFCYGHIYQYSQACINE